MTIRTAEALDPATIAAGILTFALVMFLPQVLNDGDTLWQIKTGGWILDHRAVPATDPFSFTAGDRPWFAHEWLAETALALAFRAGGLQAVMLLTAASAGLTAALLLHTLRRFLPGIYAAAGTVFALCNAAPSLLARPHLLAWPCLVLWCAGLINARADRRAPSFALLPAMLLWVNLHGSFMAGLLLSGALMIEALFDRGIDRARTAARWAGFVAAAWAVALVNPDTIGGVLFPFRMVGMTSLAWIGEWQATDFSRLQPLELVLLGALALGLSGKATLPPMRLLLFLGLVHAALTHRRNEQLLGIVGALILAEPLGRCLGRGAAAVSGRAWRRVPAAAALVAIAAACVRLALPLSPERSGEAFASVIGQVPAALRDRRVLNEYGLGGQLIFNGVRPFIDSRADLYGDAFLTAYAELAAGDPAELDRILRDYRIDWTIFPSGQPVTRLMNGRTGWTRLVDANGIAIYVRDNWQAPGGG